MKPDTRDLIGIAIFAVLVVFILFVLSPAQTIIKPGDKMIEGHVYIWPNGDTTRAPMTGTYLGPMKQDSVHIADVRVCDLTAGIWGLFGGGTLKQYNALVDLMNEKGVPCEKR